MWQQTMADFSYIFFHGKSLSAEFLGKTIFQNFFRGKFHFFPTFWVKIFRGIFPEIFRRKKCTKIGPIIFSPSLGLLCMAIAERLFLRKNAVLRVEIKILIQ
jgi:hypothetical protein